MTHGHWWPVRTTEVLNSGESSCPFEGCFHLPSISIVSVGHIEHRRSRGEVGIILFAGRKTVKRLRCSVDLSVNMSAEALLASAKSLINERFSSQEEVLIYS